MQIIKRPRRNRKSPSIRSLVEETKLSPSDFVAPLFILEGENRREEIRSLPGVFRLSIDLILKECHELLEQGITTVDLFPVVSPEEKDPFGSYALRENNLLYRATSAIKDTFPEMTVMVDVALDPYTSHGHDGLIDDSMYVKNDETIEVLSQISLFSAQAGADIIAPSDMMDGRIGAIRSTLDKNGFQNTSILSYTAKYASCFYGPFRDALGSSPAKGNKKNYQMNPANQREALLEAKLDEEEGADMLLVKPALPYLDVIAKIKEQTHLPVGAYQVSGEYAQLKLAAREGLLDFDTALLETLTSIKRAGADFIFTYGAKEAVLKM